ncbi:putative C6 and C2H2 transcription factor RegA-like [Aspergillus mulundensis]|uniref:Putative transcription factor with C2H2 and Zn(2)-Cys(6) DNA binding n=1 Tax=Aspergillus mulundensis TaxID=1810919 RepID=A0A3D8SBD9_9EURO|nr:putative transcription factor with C2H2 and Zn(2)-Cys(6) DNA binding [Aspergillus mulundensis]RDW83679.1 putative transcription factor with C2H2 and Zn(2)-Cys(6) DNA binding [Aspergillus mulundensis]
MFLDVADLDARDLLKRHAAGHSHSQDGKRKRTSSYSKNGRVSQACKACATSKLKCDEEKPCRRCRDRKLFCDYVDGSAQDAEQQGSNDENDQDEEYSPLESQTFSPPNPDINVQQLVTPGVPMDIDYLPPNTGPSTIPSYDTQTVSPLVDHESGVFSVDGTFFPEFIPDSLVSLSRPGELDPSAFPPNDYYAHRLYDHDLNFDFDLTEVDFGLIDFYNSRGSVNPALPQPDDDGDADRDSGIALGVEAYSRSSLSAWKPGHSDHAFADQNDLSVPKSIDSPEASTYSQSKQQILSERLSPGSRDLIFGMVLQTSQRANLARIMKSFPSTELLDSLIQDFFAYQEQQVDSWIHGPTFHPNEENPDMVGIVAAAAAVRSSIPTIRKLGYALMEVVRLQMSLKYENDNTTIRDLRASQTYALTIDIGIWSGSGRRTEIAESFQQPVLTMLRRGLRFRRSVYTPIVPSLEDAPSVLEQKWRDWTEQESFKRLVHHLFLHDAQSSLMLNINPLISYADLELPLPMTRALWDAKSASEWRDLYIATAPLQSPSPERLPSLVDTLRDMSAYTGRIDAQLSASVILHGLSALINEYHRLKFIAQGNGTSKHWNALVINSRQQELEQVLHHFKMISVDTNPTTPSAEIRLLYEVISMFLFMSLEDLQLFAGKEDRNEARRVYNSALEWIGSVDSRKAIWHAGQAIRSARDIMAKQGPARLTGFLAVGVYYASLAFWSYGVVSRACRTKNAGAIPIPASAGTTAAGNGVGLSPNSNTSGNFNTEGLVFLDGDETTDVHKFISLARGCPALRGLGSSWNFSFQGTTSGDGPALVSDPGRVMDVAQRLLKGDAPFEALPPLVQGLCQLMHGLGSAAGGGT